MRVLLSAQQATFSRAGEPIFKPVDIEVCGGQMVVVRGDNGAGKTTLLRMLAGILRPSAGRVTRRAGISFMGHGSAIKTELTCRENLTFRRHFARSHSGMNENAALTRVGLIGHGLRPASTLSAGQKRRLGLACLLVAPTAIWILDEPYASLDDRGCALVDELLTSHLGRDGAVVLSTHQHLPEVEFSSRQLAVKRYREIA